MAHLTMELFDLIYIATSSTFVVNRFDYYSFVHVRRNVHHLAFDIVLELLQRCYLVGVNQQLVVIPLKEIHWR